MRKGQQTVPRLSIKCRTCGKPMELLPHQITKDRKFCSSKCFGESRAGICHTEEELKKMSDGRYRWLSEHPEYSNRGPKNPHWTGGVRYKGGYKLIFAPWHPNSYQRYVREHTLKAVQALGRPLKKEECVHHINGDKLDNRNCNLLICTNSYHRWLENRMSTLYKKEHFAHI